MNLILQQVNLNQGHLLKIKIHVINALIIECKRLNADKSQK